jgi:hypothetical protein
MVSKIYTETLKIAIKIHIKKITTAIQKKTIIKK